MKQDGRFSRTVSFVLLSAMLAGCASSPDSIKASHVSPAAYSSLSCDQIHDEILRVNRQLGEACEEQEKTAHKDGVTAAVAMVIPVTLLFLAKGEDKEDEIARLKGEFEALGSAANQNNCIYKDLLIAR